MEKASERHRLFLANICSPRDGVCRALCRRRAVCVGPMIRVEVAAAVLTLMLSAGAKHEVLEGLPDGAQLVGIAPSRHTPGVVELFFQGDGTHTVNDKRVVIRRIDEH